MNICLRDRTLLLLAAGEGTGEQHAHLKTCPPCAARYQGFVRDLEAIEQVLQKTAPSPAVFSLPPFLRARWIPAAAVLTATVLLIWGGVWLQQPSQLLTANEAAREEVLRFLEDEVSPALFATVDTHVVPVPNPVSNFTYLEAALEGEWPCEQQEPFLNPTCEGHPFPLLVKGQ